MDALHKPHQRYANSQKPKGPTRDNNPPTSRGSANQDQLTRCGRCGRGPHGRGRCPAKDAVCLGCKKTGHYKAMCRSGGVDLVDCEDTDNDCFYMGAIFSAEIDSIVEGRWQDKLFVNGARVQFKLDTGADVTVVPEDVYKKLKVKLQSTSKVLTGPSQQNLDVLGSFHAVISNGKRETNQVVYVVKGLRCPLLGRPAIEALDVVSMVEKLSSQPEAVYEHFPNLLSGLGKLGGEYRIDLKEDSTPYAVTAPRRIPLPLMEKVKEKLARLESQGVISPIEIGVKPLIGVRQWLWCLNRMGKFAYVSISRN